MELDQGKLFVGGISWDTNEERLREYFQRFGDVVEATIMKDRATGRARGFGFVVFADPAVAERVIMEKHLLDGRMVEAKKAVPRDDQSILGRSTPSIHGSPVPTRTKKIFVGGLASSVTDADFRDYFEKFGAITDVVVMYDHTTQRPRGFGFITYESDDSVDKVLTKKFHELNGKLVEVKRAVPKELSPSPNTRSPIGGYNMGMNRINNLFNGLSHAYNPSSISGYGLRMDATFGPLSNRRTGFPSFNPGYGIGMNFEPGMNSNYNTGLNYGRTLSPYYNVNSNRFNSPIGYGGNVSPGSVFNSPGRNLWGNGGNLNYNNSNSGNSNSFFASGIGNTAPNWSGSPSHITPHINNSFAATNIGYRGGESTRYDLGASDYGRSNRQGSSENNDINFNALRNGYEGKFSDSYASGSVYGDPTWHSASSDLDGPNPFGYGLGNEDPEVMPKGSTGYVGGYSVTGRQTNGGLDYN